MSAALSELDFDSVLEAYEKLRSVCQSAIENSSNDETTNFAMDSLKEVNMKLEKELRSLLNDVFKKIEYPFEDVSDLRPFQNEFTKMRGILTVVHSMRRFVDDNKEEESAVGGSDYSTKYTAIQWLIEPLEKRFRFHFYGDRKTNNIDKPEWFYTQLICWAQAHAFLFVNEIQPIFHSEDVQAISELQKELVGMAVHKVETIIETCMQNPVRFSHLIDETVIFEMEITAMGYRESDANVLEKLIEDGRLLEWIELEKESCTGRVDTLLMHDQCWHSRFGTAAHLDLELRVPECADAFVTLLQLITERYRLIRNIPARLHFLQMQLQLLDDFRMRLLQIGRHVPNAWQVPFPQLMNAFWYIIGVLEDWNSLPFFVNLKQASNTGKKLSGAFDEALELYRHGWTLNCTDMAKSIVEGDIRPSVQIYKQQKWFAHEKSNVKDLSPTFCPCLLVLRGRLRQISASLSSDSIPTLMKMLIGRLGKLLVDEVLFETSFNSYGASQMLYDVESALIPLLNSIDTDKVHSQFDQGMMYLTDSLKILSLSRPHAILLKETLQRTPKELSTETLSEFGVTSLDGHLVIDLLAQRSDLQS